MAIRLYNTLTRRKEEFKPQEDMKVRMYGCGPTTYDFFHLGNARTFVLYDVLRRYLKYRGYEVTFVQNFTDVDDKIINRALEEGLSAKDLSERYIREYYQDAKDLGILEADVHPKVTDHIEGIIQYIEGLIAKGYAYESDGDVYFSVEQFAEYGKLSHRNIKDLLAGARVEVTEIKRSPADFVLWKKAKEGEPFWDSPWGRGRPGWHIECSVMSQKYLGETLDIHAGGTDLVFPHHENEIAQSEALTGKPFANLWVHGAFLNVDGEKMAKSEGNFFTVRQLLEKYSGEELRFFLISAQYRHPLNYNAENLKMAAASLKRLHDAKDNFAYWSKIALERELDGKEKELLAKLKSFEERFIQVMDDDLNTADAIAVLFEIVREGYAILNEQSAKSLLLETVEVLKRLSAMLGILREDERIDGDFDSLLELVLDLRNDARNRRDWAMADKVRDKLLAMGIVLEDTNSGTKWKKTQRLD